ncbi:hypothetical protein EDD74_11744 [Faecalimonas umbilicata]|uniref:Uncharacterized protein n=1 Tax=Faecalimonas umbilicata TaxID=1912855 RepID=A0A4R3JKG5_9FIRM|nr:hypothetical protein [Faecalimonas umbilicata]TCS66787.1 hypothetical protein EDD74_11744 [Faecalimonas umbilicata]GBU04694.1 hypothetical protein FAEUMB_12350 [Faecalimonas umbilicata]
MDLKKIEILLLVIVAFFICILFFELRTRKKDNNCFAIALTLCILMEIFIGIHFLFCYQIGFPASVTQNDRTDLNLNASDWLGFLGSYLGFSGSLIMAYLVYRQSKVIDELTILEYKPSISIMKCICVKSTDYVNEFEIDNLIQYLPDDLNTYYYTYHLKHCKVLETEYEKFNLLLFVEIMNNSKLTINNFSFLSIEIKGINNSYSYIYTNLGEQWDPANKNTQINPGGKLKRCFIIEDIPRIIDISWMILRFTYDENQDFDIKLLVSKNQGETLTFLSISD